MPCFPSLAGAEKKLLRLQGKWLKEPEEFPTHVSSRKGNKTAIMAAARETKGHLAAARRTEEALRPRGCETPSGPFGACPPARRDSSFLPASTAYIHKFVKAGTLYHSIPQFVFQMVLNPQDSATPNTLPACYSEGTTGQPSSSHAISARNNLLAPSVRL